MFPAVIPQPLQLLGGSDDHINRHCQHDDADGSARCGNHYAAELRFLAPKLSEHGGFQRKHGNQRSRQIDDLGRRHHRAAVLPVFDHVDNR